MASLLSSLQERLKAYPETGTQCTPPVYNLLRKGKRNKIKDCIETTCHSEDFVNVDHFKDLEDVYEHLQSYTSKHKVKLKKNRKRDFSEISLPVATYVTESFICSVLQKSLTDESFWTENDLKLLISNQYVSSGTHEMMFKCIFKHNALGVLETIAEQKLMVGVRFVIALIKHIVRSISKHDVEKLSTQVSFRSCPVSQDTAKSLLCVLQLECDEYQLKEYLKLLSTDEAVVLFQFLHFVLYQVSPALSNKDCEEIELADSIDERKVMIWMDAVLTAHLLTLTSSPTLTQLVAQFRLTLSKQKHFYFDISILSPYIDCLKRLFELPQLVEGDYSVEVIKL